MANFFVELKRRHIYRVGAAYVVVAWALTQLVEILAQVFTLPLWIAQLAIVLLAVGFPIALFIAWTIESKPHEAVASAVRSRPTIVDWTLCGALAIVMLLIGYQQIAPSFDATAPQPGVDTARSKSLDPAGAVSVAVLPFANLSSDPEQEFFSDGMTEEITTALAKVADLRVVGRTSAFQFKGENQDLRAIGQRLNATHLIEGSVRKAGDRVRITVQLIKADDGTHLWSENYDRQLTDIFAIQEDIARTVTTSLNMSLGLNPGQNLVDNRSVDSESYEKFLRAKALFMGRGGGNTEQAAEQSRAASLLEEVVAKNPSYAPGWGYLGATYFTIANVHVQNINEPIDQTRAIVDDLREKGETAAQKLLQLNPTSPDGHVLLGIFAWSKGKLLDADALFEKGLAFGVSSDALGSHGLRLAAAGRVKEALPIIERAYALDPLYPVITTATADHRWLNGDTDGAIAVAKSARPVTRAPLLSMIYASLGRFQEAANALEELTSNSAATQTARLLRSAPSTIASEELPRLPAAFEFVYLYVGAPERAIDGFTRRIDAGFFTAGTPARVWHPSYAAVRKTERFKALMRKAGLVEYWRVKGWPDQCRPVGPDDFACD